MDNGDGVCHVGRQSSRVVHQRATQYVPLDHTVPVTTPPCCTAACDVAEQTELLSVPTASPTVVCEVNDIPRQVARVVGLSWCYRTATSP